MQDDHGDVLHQGNMEWAIKVLERMENQNTYKELAMDFKVLPFCCHSCSCPESCCGRSSQKTLYHHGILMFDSLPAIEV